MSLVTGLGFHQAEELVERLYAASIDVHVQSDTRREMTLWCPEACVEQARPIVEDLGLMPLPAVGVPTDEVSIGSCSACGARMLSLSPECPDCGLVLGSEPDSDS